MINNISNCMFVNDVLHNEVKMLSLLCDKVKTGSSGSLGGCYHILCKSLRLVEAGKVK